ncbi:tape measure protein [Novosphingobium sp. NPDC080210]|uniref:tape measure protein n=1 Tax=Novosphingobium sp. NPDC080210 TaxID=3390596 RepID=UPI003CFDBED4
MAQRRLQIVLDLDTGAYSGRLNAAGGQMRKFGGDVSQASKGVDAMGQAFGRLGSHLNTPRQKLRDYVLILGNIHFAILNVQNALVGWVAGLVKQSAEVERLTVLMKGLSTATTQVGKAAEAKKNLEDLFQMARSNGIAVNSLTDAFVKLKSAGIDPMKGSLQGLTNAVSFFGGSNETFHRASIAIQQMAGKGVISMEELRQQLGEAVPTAMADMARAMGMSMKDFTKVVSDGKVQAKPALELMFREFELMYAGAGSRMANTLNGQLATFKTNVTELSTYFTQLADGNTPEFQRQVEEARVAFEQGKISAQEYQEAITPKAGLFAGVVDALRQVNEAMRTNEAREAMRSLGEGVNSVLKGLVSTAQFIVRWRTEIGAAITALVVGFAAVKATQIAGWFLRLGAEGVMSMRALGSSITQVHPALQGVTAASQNYATALNRVQSIQQLRIASNQRIITQSNQTIAALGQEANAQRAKAAIIGQQIQLITNQRNAEIRQLNTAKTLHQANVAMGRDTTQSLRNVDAAQQAVNRSGASLIRLRAQQRTATQAAVNAERGLTAATAAQSAAQGRMNILTAAGSTALRVKTVAANMAAMAVRGLGIAVNFALGPIGMLIIALGTAAYQAGVFESAADRAAAAAARLAQGIANVEDMKNLQRNGEILDKNIKEAESFQKGGPLGLLGSPNKNSNYYRNYKGSGMNLDQYLADQRAKRDANSRQINFGKEIISAQTGRDHAQGTLARRGVYFEQLGGQYQAELNNAKKRFGEGTPAFHKESDRLSKKYSSKRSAYDKAMVETAQNLANGETGLNQVGLNAYAQSLRDATGATTDLSQSTDKLRTAALGGADATGKGGKAAKDAKEKLSEADKATRRFESAIEANIGTIAQMQDELADGNGAFAKFQAQLKNTDKYANMSKDQIEALGESFKEIDRLAGELDFKRAFDRMAKDADAAKTAADRLWTSLKNGTFNKDVRNTQIDTQYADELKNTKDPAKLEKLNGMIEQIKASTAQADAAQVMQDWQDMTEETMISLMDEDEAREANFQRDIQRMRDSIDWSRLSADQKIIAEQRYAAAVSAMRQKLDREQEGSMMKMFRQWYKLGENMDAAMAGAIENFVNNLAEGKASFADFAKEIIKALVKVIIKALIAYAIMSALGMTNGASLGDYLKGGLSDFGKGMGGSASSGGSGGGSSDTAGTSGETPPKMHTGGWIGMPALKPGEVPLIGQEGEAVLTKDHQRFYANALSGAGQAPNVSVNIINNSGTAVTAEQGEPRMDGKSMIVDVVVEAMNKQGPLRDNLQRMMKS